MIVGNYSGHLAFAMNPLFCTVYSLDFINKDDPATMTFRNQENHPVSLHQGWPDHMPATHMGLHGVQVWDDHPQQMSSHPKRHAVH